MQETFLAVYRHRHDIDENSVKGYLARTALNKSRDYIRKNSKHMKVPLNEDIPAEDRDIAGDIIGEEILMKIKGAINTMRGPYADILKSYYLDGENITSYAKRTDTNVKTAQTRMRRAREMLRNILGKEYGDG